MKRAGAFVLAMILLAGCATDYQKFGLTGGYRDKQLGPDTYRVWVSTNAYTSEERASQIMLLRAAELILQNGYPKFVVESNDLKTKSTWVASGAMVVPIDYPAGSLVFRTVKADDPAAAHAHDAATVKAELEPKLKK